MKLRALVPLSLLLCSYARITDYGFIVPTDYEFVTKKHHWHVEGDYRQVGRATFRTEGFKHTKLRYADGYGNAFYSRYVNPENFLSLQAGYTYLELDWPQNPRFGQKQFHFGTASLGWVSNTLKNWRWVLSGGASVDTHSWNFGRTAVYNMMMWGRYTMTQTSGMHIGFWGYTGVHNFYVLPVIGIDWAISKHWALHAIFPFDMSLICQFTNNWSAAVALKGFGGPYRYSFRAREGRDGFHSPIGQITSSGVEGNLNYKGSFLSAGIGGGWNFGGWLLIRNKENEHGRYFKFKTAPYAQGNLSFTF